MCCCEEFSRSNILVPPKLDTDKPLEPTLQVKAGGNIFQQFTYCGVPTPALAWTVNGQPVDGSQFTVSTDCTSLSIKNCNVKNAGTYEVTATNEVGSDKINFNVIVTDKPSAPQALEVVEVTKDSCSLRWEPPEFNGGADILHYVVEKRDASKTSWFAADTLDGATLECVVSKLFEGNQYYFRVMAENKVGPGPAAEISEPVTACLPFGTFLSNIFSKFF